MPIYLYKCHPNGHRIEDYTDREQSSRLTNSPCPACIDGTLKRSYSFQSARPGVMEGYVVPGLSASPEDRFTASEIDREARRVSEEYSRRMGYEVNLRQVSMNDPIVAPDSDDGLKSQHDRAIAEGRKDAERKVL